MLGVAASRGAVGDSLWFGRAAFAGCTVHPLVLSFALSGSLMVSRIRFPKL
jgi:CDP-diacylglycerol--serine O-phosphatidyltransferase